MNIPFKKCWVVENWLFLLYESVNGMDICKASLLRYSFRCIFTSIMMECVLMLQFLPNQILMGLAGNLCWILLLAMITCHFNYLQLFFKQRKQNQMFLHYDMKMHEKWKIYQIHMKFCISLEEAQIHWRFIICHWSRFTLLHCIVPWPYYTIYW